jgi:hypothetical protein
VELPDTVLLLTVRLKSWFFRVSCG